MNFLAHAWLSGENEMVTAANVTGDAYKGKISAELPTEFRAGLQLHRYIDKLTDTNEELKKAALLLRPHYGRYSGVALDVWLDHILASEFEKYHTLSLRQFSDSVYKCIQNHQHLLNTEARLVGMYMWQHDWLFNYTSASYIHNVFYRMSKRFNVPALAGIGHPEKNTLDYISLIFSNLNEEIKEKSQEKLRSLLNE
jgi:acyl carrier protein phosphodiesterase